MRVAVTGASGMLGTALISELSNFFDIFATSRTMGVEKDGVNWSCFDLSNPVLLSNWLFSSQPNVIIHCAAIVNVDSCEESPSSAYQLHANVVSIINGYIKKNSGYLIYISTDSIFDGKSLFPYSENDHPNPINIYSKSKALGECLTIQNESGVVLRTNIIGWGAGNALSFSEWILKGLIVGDTLNLFNDVYFSPVHVKTLSHVILKLIEKKLYGIYNVSSNKGISKYDFGILIANEFGLSTKNINSLSSFFSAKE